MKLVSFSPIIGWYQFYDSIEIFIYFLSAYMKEPRDTKVQSGFFTSDTGISFSF